MPIHDWTRVQPGTFHDFHQDWTIEIRRMLNGGILPEGYYAFAEQRVGGPEPDVVKLELQPTNGQPVRGGTTVAVAPHGLRQVALTDKALYARKANRIAVRHELGRIVSVIEIVSPGNKDSASAITSFVGKVCDFIQHGFHVLVIDVFPPTPRDPEGLDPLIWDALVNSPSEPRPADKPLTVAAYEAKADPTAYAAHLAFGDPLPDAPVFLQPGWSVTLPLEESYRRSWAVLPKPVRDRVDPPADR